MRKITGGIILIAFLFQFTNVKAQSEFEKGRYVFWFYIKAEIKKDRELRKPVYKVRRTNKDIKSGKIKKFQNDVWRNIKSGNQLVVGPFLELEDAKRSNEMYNLGRKTNEQMEKEIAATRDTATIDDYYAYLLVFKFSNRTSKYLIKRQPAAVFPTDLPGFKEMLWDVLNQKQLVMGPFRSLMEAEESKRLYRLEESYDSESENEDY